jgi:cytochrome c-type biogenesis protein CcmH
MQRLKVCLLALVVGLAALAQTASEKPNADVRRVGMRLQCQCGCKDSVSTCSMLGCESSKPAKERIARMQAVGMSDEQIVDAFLREGFSYLSTPSSFGWVVPYSVAGLGLVVIWWFVRRYYKPKPVAATAAGPMELDDPELEKYKDQIEKEMADLE